MRGECPPAGPAGLAGLKNDILERVLAPLECRDLAATRLACRALCAAARGRVRALTLAPSTVPADGGPDWSRSPALERLVLWGWRTWPDVEALRDAFARAPAGGAAGARAAARVLAGVRELVVRGSKPGCRRPEGEDVWRSYSGDDFVDIYDLRDEEGDTCSEAVVSAVLSHALARLPGVTSLQVHVGRLSAAFARDILLAAPRLRRVVVAASGDVPASGDVAEPVDPEASEVLAAHEGLEAVELRGAWCCDQADMLQALAPLAGCLELIDANLWDERYDGKPLMPRLQELGRADVAGAGDLRAIAARAPALRSVRLWIEHGEYAAAPGGSRPALPCVTRVALHGADGSGDGRHPFEREHLSRLVPAVADLDVCDLCCEIPSLEGLTALRTLHADGGTACGSSFADALPRLKRLSLTGAARAALARASPSRATALAALALNVPLQAELVDVLCMLAPCRALTSLCVRFRRFSGRKGAPLDAPLGPAVRAWAGSGLRTLAVLGRPLARATAEALLSLPSLDTLHAYLGDDAAAPWAAALAPRLLRLGR